MFWSDFEQKIFGREQQFFAWVVKAAFFVSRATFGGIKRLFFSFFLDFRLEFFRLGVKIFLKGSQNCIIHVEKYNLVKLIFKLIISIFSDLDWTFFGKVVRTPFYVSGETFLKTKLMRKPMFYWNFLEIFSGLELKFFTGALKTAFYMTKRTISWNKSFEKNIIFFRIWANNFR